MPASISAKTFLYSVPDSGYIFPGHLSNATLAGPRVADRRKRRPRSQACCDFIMLLIFFYVFQRLYPGAHSELAARQRLTQTRIHFLAKRSVTLARFMETFCKATPRASNPFAIPSHPREMAGPPQGELGVPDAICARIGI